MGGEAGGSGLGAGRENCSRCWGRSAQEAGGGRAAPNFPRCAREIEQQEAAVGNPGAGNSRCRPPDIPQACETPSPAASPHSWVPPRDAPSLPSGGAGGAQGLPRGRGSASLWEAVVPSGYVGAVGNRDGATALLLAQLQRGGPGLGKLRHGLATDQAGQLAKAGVTEPLWREVCAPLPPLGALPPCGHSGP